MDLQDAVSRFYLDITLNELKLMNQSNIQANISYNSLLYLDLIASQENCTASTLAQLLHISKPGVTAKINELVAQGLVTKRQSERDKRVYYLSVSDAMKEEYRAYDRRQHNATERVKAAYTPKQIATFIEMLDEFRKEYLKEP